MGFHFMTRKFVNKRKFRTTPFSDTFCKLSSPASCKPAMVNTHFSEQLIYLCIQKLLIEAPLTFASNVHNHASISKLIETKSAENSNSCACVPIMNDSKYMFDLVSPEHYWVFNAGVPTLFHTDFPGLFQDVLKSKLRFSRTVICGKKYLRGTETFKKHTRSNFVHIKKKVQDFSRPQFFSLSKFSWFSRVRGNPVTHLHMLELNADSCWHFP